MRSHCVTRRAVLAAALAAAVFAAGCDRRQAAAAPPAPQEVQAESTGHYCGMLLAEHEGPKGQIFVAGRSDPVWFSSVRDTIAFLRSPDEPRNIAAVYLNDMGRSKHWDQPDPGSWVDARVAWFVIESRARGGMGAPEAVPFSEHAAADAFRVANGGRVVRLDDIPQTYLTDSGTPPPAEPGAEKAAGGTKP